MAILHIEILTSAMVLDGRVYEKGQIVPDPPFGVEENLKNAIDVELVGPDGKKRKAKAFCGYKGKPLYREVEKSELTIKGKPNPAIVNKFSSIPGMPGHPDPEKGHAQLKGYQHSLKTAQGAKDAGLDGPVIDPRDLARAEAEAKAKKETAAKEKAEKKAAAEKEKAEKKAATEKEKADKKSKPRGRGRPKKDK